MSYWFGKTRSPIGIDVGHRFVKAVQLRGSPGRWSIHRTLVDRRAHPDQPFTGRDAGHLLLALNGKGFSGRDTVLAVPDDRVLTGNLELPPLKSKAPLEQIARVELARIHQCDPQGLEMACWGLPHADRTGKTTPMMAVACPTTEATNLLETFEAEGFKIRALDVQACALARACRLKLDPESSVGMILDVGWSATRLVVLYQGVVVYERLLRDGGIRHLVESLAAQLHIKPQSAESLISDVGLEDPDTPEAMEPTRRADARLAMVQYFDAVAEELQLSLAYTVHRYRDVTVNHMLLVGGGAGIAGLAGFLSRVLGLKLTRVQGTDLAQVRPDSDVSGTEAIVAALGLAQHPEW